MSAVGFNDEMIQRSDLPEDAFELIHDLCYHVESRDAADYVRRAQKILKRKTFKMRVPLDLARLMADEDPEAKQEFISQGALALGKIKTPKKATASRKNGKLGGRPKSRPTPSQVPGPTGEREK